MSEDLEKLEWPSFLEFLAAEASTEAGVERIKNFAPAFSYAEALERQNQFRELKAWSEKTGIFRLPKLRKIKPFVSKAQKGSLLQPEELHEILKNLETARTLTSLSFFPSVSPLESLYQELRFSLDPSGQELADQASPELAAARKRIRHFFERLHKVLEALLRKYARAGLLQEEHLFQRKGRLVLPVRSEHRHKVPGILHDVSQSGATVFIEPSEAVPLSNELEAARLEEERIKREILKRLSGLVAQEAEALESLEEALSWVDLGLAAHSLAQRYQGRFPKLKARGTLKLKAALHPFFPLRGEEAIRNHFFLSSEKPLLLISGPNFGGKTVALKTVGLNVLLAQAGLPVAAEEDSEIPVWRSILVDLGDDQGLLLHESSFSAHLKALSRILKEAGPESLVLLDEPGRGTDPREGAALAKAVLERLLAQQARVMVTTHYPELKHWAWGQKEVTPASMAFDEKEGQPTYRLLYGGLSASYGLGLARRYLPPEVVEQAQKHLAGEEPAFSFLKTLQGLEQELQEKRKLLERREREIEAKERALEIKEKRLEEALEIEKEKLRQEVERRFRDLENQFWSFRVRVGRQGKKAVQKELQAWKKALEAPLEAPEPEQKLSPGQRVWLKEWRREGEVIRDLGNKVEVKSGAFRVAVSKKSIKVLSDAHFKPRVQISVPERQAVPQSLHLLGMRADEALSVLERYLNQALLAGLKEVRIVHGLGTGRLLQAVRDYLREHEMVEAIRSGAPFEGGEGVTVVTLLPKKEAA